MNVWLGITDQDGDTRCIGEGTWEWCQWFAFSLDPSVEATIVDRWITLTRNGSRVEIEKVS